MKTFVYVISGDHGRQKIGVSDNPRQRIRDLQTGSPYTLKFEFIGDAEDGAAGPIEVESHFMLNQHKAPGGDEWFVVPPDVAITAVMAAAHRLGYRLKPVDPDTVAPKCYLVGRPAWHKWAAIPPLVAGLFLFLPALMKFDRGAVDGYYLIGAFIGFMAIIVVGQWGLIKLAEVLISFDRAMHPEDGAKGPLPLD